MCSVTVGGNVMSATVGNVHNSRGNVRISGENENDLGNIRAETVIHNCA